MEVRVCIGSACHLKGSYTVIKKLKEYIAINDMEKDIILKSDFCLGECSDGVSVKINDEKVDSIYSECVEDYFNNNIMGGLNK